MNKAIEWSTFLVLLSFTVVTCQNCSTYNPCGQYGYCENNVNGVWECQCKFWWIGTYCNEQSTNGIQVIVLGVIVAAFIGLFYGLSIFCSIRRKKQQQLKTEPQQIDQINPSNLNLTSAALINVKQSARLSSCIIAFLMLIMTAVALVIKWLLLQPIHDELVIKFQQGGLLFYNRNSFCSLVDYQDFNMLTFPIASVLILIFVVFSKRISCVRNKLKGYCAPIIPVDFYSHVKRKFPIMVFAIIADELLEIINQVINGDTSTGDGVLVVYLLQVAHVFVIGIRYYPILSAIHIDSILALTCATLYAWLDFCVTIVYQSLCQSDFYPSDDNFNETEGTDIERFFEYYGTGPNLIIIQLFTDIPRYVCWSYIIIKLPMLLVHKIYKTIKRRNEHQSMSLHLTREEKTLLHSSFIDSVEMCYVRNLFRPTNQRSIHSRSICARLIPKFIYQWRDDFRFSTCVLCIYSSIFLLMYFMAIQACILVVPHLSAVQSFIQEVIDLLTSINSDEKKPTEFPVPNLVWPYVIAILASFFITIIQLLVLLANIRRNLFQIFRGDDSEIPKRDSSKSVNYSTGNFHFAGFFIGYLVWGYVLIAIFVLIICICLDAFMVFGSVRLLEILLKYIIPVLLLIFFKQYLNNLLARYVFLQHYGDLLAINNRRILMIFLYFNFFLDAFLGFVSSILRIIKSVIGGCLYMARLDYSPLGRKLETFDAGFSAYCGFIHIEAVHRNPVMLAVASYLYGRMKLKQHAVMNVTTITNNDRKRPYNYSSKSIRKWYLAIFLLQNPSMVLLRKSCLFKTEDNKVKALNEIKRKQSCLQQQPYRPSLVSEIDLQNMWQK